MNVDGDTKFVGVYPTYFEAVAVQDAYLRAFGIKHRVLKKEQDEINLREKYDEKCVNGVAMQLFKGKEGRKDSSTGYRGVLRYFTRISREERFKAVLVVAGKTHSKYGFLTAEDAYYNGRLELEAEYLPHKN